MEAATTRGRSKEERSIQHCGRQSNTIDWYPPQPHQGGACNKDSADGLHGDLPSLIRWCPGGLESPLLRRCGMVGSLLISPRRGSGAPSIHTWANEPFEFCVLVAAFAIFGLILIRMAFSKDE